MKRILCFLLATVLLLSGCAQTVQPAAQETVPETTLLPTGEATAPTTEATLSAEELFLQSLPEKLRTVYEMGFVELEALEDLDKVCTKGDVLAILQKVVTARLGRESWMYAHALVEGEAEQEATKEWIATMLYVGEAETVEERKSEDYVQNLKQLTCTTTSLSNSIGDALLMSRGFVYMPNNANPGIGIFNSYAPQTSTVSAYCGYGNYSGGTKYVADKREFDGDTAILSYAISRYDTTTGEKLLPWDENRNFYPDATLTMQEMLELALRYYNCVENTQNIPYEAIGTYDPAIITPDLLEKETNLPTPTCQELPAQWHGIWVWDLNNNATRLDVQLYEYELDAIDNAGFNYIQVPFDFCLLRRWDAPEGTLDENRLKQLDQILAWCMERDIHLNLSCNGFNEYKYPASSNEEIYRDPASAAAFAKQWAVLAKRYADIPNEYLSFTLLCYGMPLDDVYASFCSPAIDSIRAITPERCMIAEIARANSTGEPLAALGVALSSHCDWGNALSLNDSTRIQQSDKYFQSAVWPYEENGKLVDGNSSMCNKIFNNASPDDIAAIAEQYGVGYMISTWGPSFLYSIAPADRFKDDVMEAYLTDMTQTMADRGYGWCYRDWFGCTGIASGFPQVTTTTYTQIEDYPLYIDEEMTAWFRQINTVE